MSSNGPSEEKVEEMVPLQESVYDLNEEAETGMRSGDENDMRSGDGNDNLETINENWNTFAYKCYKIRTPSRLQDLVRKHHAIVEIIKAKKGLR